MGLTSGFFDSVSGDRKYNTFQMSSIFDGIITDGVYEAYGDAFFVAANGSYDLNIGIGRAWFNHTWTLNDSVLLITAETADSLLPRYDEVVLEVNTALDTRQNTIKILKGVAASTPSRPALTKSDTVNQYSLATITRPAGSTGILQSNVQNRVGSSETPFVTGPLQVLNIDNFIAQWGAQWSEWYDAKTTAADNDMGSWETQRQSDFDAWYAALQNTLAGDQAANLAAQISDLQAKFDSLETEHTLYQSLTDSSGAVITDSAAGNISAKIVYAIL